MNLNTLRELFTENPMTTEGTRTLRRMLRVGGDGENPYASKILYRFIFYTLAVLYFWLVTSLLRTEEDLSMVLLMGELALLTLLVPGSLYGAIAVEREKQTYESLMMTRLSPAQIVAGKLVWRVWLIAGIIALCAPLLVITHQMGAHRTYGNDHLTWGELAWSQVVIFAWSVCIGAFALWVSAKSKKGITALLGTVAGLIAFLAVVPALFGIFRGDGIEVDYDIPFVVVSESFHQNNVRVTREFNQGGADYIRLVVSSYAASLPVALNPVAILLAPRRYTLGGDDYDHFLPIMTYWRYIGISYWGVAVYAGLAAIFVRAATKTLRGLELPVAEKTRRARFALSLTPKGKGA